MGHWLKWLEIGCYWSVGIVLIAHKHRCWMDPGVLVNCQKWRFIFFSFTIYHKEKVTMLCAWNSLLVIVQRQRIVAQRTTCAVRVICIRTRTPQDSSMMKKRNSALCRARFYPANQKFRLLFCIRNQWLMISIPPLLFFVINQWPIRFRRLQ